MVCWAGVCLLVLAAPFETLRPLVRLPGQSISSVEAVILGLLASWAATLVWSRRLPNWRTPLTSAWVGFGVASLLAAIVAPSERTNALHAVGRLVLAFGIYLAAVAGASTFKRLQGIVVTCAVAGALVGLLVVLDYTHLSPVNRLLEAFRASEAMVGDQIRASGPFQYPSIASMYLEIVFALALGLLLVAVDAGRVRAAALVMLVSWLIVYAVALTFTRAGLLTVMTSLLMVGWLRWRRAGLDRGVAMLGLTGAGVLVLVATSRPAEALHLRFTTEGQSTWYRATVAAPLELTIPTGSVLQVPVRVTNSGRRTWTTGKNQRFRFSHHWLAADGDQVVRWFAPRTEFVAPVPPGSTVGINAALEAPRWPGRYLVLWDVEQEHLLWFSTEPGAERFTTLATVTGPAAEAATPPALSPFPKPTVRPGRLELWPAALQMFASRPLMGVGPDNFRLRYGEFASVKNADPRVHSNNMYLEILAGGGLLGGATFLFLICRSGKAFVSAALGEEPERAALGAAIAAAGAAIALHGLVDSFLSFTATYSAIAIVLGLAVASVGPSQSHANRV